MKQIKFFFLVFISILLVRNYVFPLESNKFQNVYSSKITNVRPIEKANYIEQGLVIMDYFIRSLKFKRMSKILKRIHTKKCERNVFTPYELDKVISEHSRKFTRKIKSVIKNVGKKSKLNKKTTKYSRNKIRSKRTSKNKKLGLLYRLYKSRDYNLKANSLLSKIYKSSFNSIIKILKKFLVKCFGAKVFLTALRAIKSLKKARNSIKQHKIYTIVRVLRLMDRLVRANKNLKRSKYSRFSAKKKLLKRLGSLLARFVLFAIHT